MGGGVRKIGWRQKRVVALLLALADLAERAACRAAPVRWLVLWSLWQAEFVAREHVRSALSAAARPVPAGVLAGFAHAPGDALGLARSLRRLALVVRAMAARITSTNDDGPDGRFDCGAGTCASAQGLPGRAGIPAQAGRTPVLWRLPTGPPFVVLC